MPFRTLTDPVAFARASMALEMAWARLKRHPCGNLPSECQRARLAYFVATYASDVEDEVDLAERAIVKFLNSWLYDSRA